MKGHEENLLALYEQATRAHVRRGRLWYPMCRGALRELALEHERALSQVAAVFAIMSVDAQLKTTLRWTKEVLEGERKAGRYPKWQAHKIEAALKTRYPAKHVIGPKVRPFYHALMGDTDALVLDRWAIRAAGVEVKREPNVGQRRILDSAYRTAAAVAGEAVAHFQAIVWIVCRETTPKSNGIVPRLFDINGFSDIRESEGGVIA